MKDSRFNIFVNISIGLNVVQDVVGKLEDKVKMYKRLADNAEEMASSNLAKLRKAQVGLEEEYLISLYLPIIIH